jgi:HSP20 family protein
MTLVRYEPISLFDQFNREINRIVNGTAAIGNTSQERNWMPAVDIREEDERFILAADLPGVERKDVDVTLEDGVLSIRGERNVQTEEKREGFHRRERVHGTFLRQFTLPDTVNAEQISATVKDGVLEVIIPKQDKPEPRKIAVS